MTIIFIESCNVFSKAPLRSLAIALMEKVRETNDIGILEVIHVTEARINRSWELFKGRPDKDWSLTDCISFVVMQDRCINKVFTTDRHFEQAGFEKLLGY